MSVVAKIRTRGYWRIRLLPIAYEKEMYELHDLEEAIKAAEVALIGWNYPHVNPSELIRGNDYIGCEVDWQNHLESWRMYQSGQYVHYLGLWEDWFDQHKTLFGTRPYKDTKPGEILEISMTVHTVTQVFLFVQRLATKGFFKKGLTVCIDLNNIEGRMLGNLDQRRVEFVTTYTTEALTINYERVCRQEEIMAQYKELAYQAVDHFFQRFGWGAPNNMNFIRQKQEDLLQGRL